MKNYPFISLSRGFWLLVAFAIITNTAALTNHPIIKAKWVHAQTEDWQAVNGIWTHSTGETWTLVPAKTLFDICGALIYFPALLSLAAVLGSLAVHLFYRQTVDADTNSGKYLEDWRALPADKRVLFANIVRVGYFIGACLVAAAIAK